MVPSTPASGKVYDVSDSPSVRHKQSPKYSYSYSFILRTWPTPVKSESFRTRTVRDTVKMAFSQLDETVCNLDAPVATSVTCTVEPSVGEQDPG